MRRDSGPLHQRQTGWALRKRPAHSDWGVNNHHDLGALGAAFNVRAAQRQLEILREMGCNAIRTRHNPPAPELLELADRMGFLVMDEILRLLETRKGRNDYHLSSGTGKKRTAGRNPPRPQSSLGLSLEHRQRGGRAELRRAGGRLIARQNYRHRPPGRPHPPRHRLDELGQAELAVRRRGRRHRFELSGRRHPRLPGVRQFQGNRTPPQYPAFREQFPQKPILSSESAAAYSTRGAYLFPVEAGISAPVRDGLAETQRPVR